MFNFNCSIMQKCLVTVLLCLISVYVRAQYQVTGKVIDQSGETLIGELYEKLEMSPMERLPILMVSMLFK